MTTNRGRHHPHRRIDAQRHHQPRAHRRLRNQRHSISRAHRPSQAPARSSSATSTGNQINTASSGGDSGTLTIGPNITIEGTDGGYRIRQRWHRDPARPRGHRRRQRQRGAISRSTAPTGQILARLKPLAAVSSLYGTNWTNSGTIEATNGGYLGLYGTWSSWGPSPQPAPRARRSWQAPRATRGQSMPAAAPGLFPGHRDSDWNRHLRRQWRHRYFRGDARRIRQYGDPR